MLAQFDVHVIWSVEHFVLEGTEGILGAYVIKLVDDSLDHGVLVHKDSPDEVFVGPVSFAEVQVGDMTSEGKALGYLVVVYGFGRGNDGTRYLRVSEVVVIELQLVGYHA